MSQFFAVDIQEIKPTVQIDPFEEIWRRLVITLIIVNVGGILMFAFFQFVDLTLPAPIPLIVNLMFAVFPAFVWLGIVTGYTRNDSRLNSSYPRTFALTSLIVLALGVPLINQVIAPEQWLSDESTAVRILGYALTVGVVQEILKYLVVRYTAWDTLDNRADGLLHCMSAAFACATVISLTYLLLVSPTPQSFSNRVLANVGINIGCSLLICYVMVNTRLKRLALYTMPVAFVLACLLTGFAITFRSGVANAQITLDGAAPRPVFALVFSIVFGALVSALARFIFVASERRVRNQLKGR